MDTFFAPAERSGAAEVSRSFAQLKAQLPYDAVLDLVPDISFIVNESRQVLFANSAALSMLGLESAQVLGARPGELLDCIHSREMPGGCGSSEACRVCGAIGAVLDALGGQGPSSKECRITTQGDGKSASLDLLVTAMPIVSPQGRFAVVTMSDIGDAKRRQLLERLFFHDLMNSISSLQACVILLNKEFGQAISEHDYFSRLSSVVQGLIDEVSQQRELITMENGDLVPEPTEIDLEALAKKTIRKAELADYARDRVLGFAVSGPPSPVWADPILLGRVIVNMLKNALEASLPGQEAALRINYSESEVEISVHNSLCIPRDEQLQIFQRSFSTKGKGRGIGTYSMRMLTEEYLGGEISFSSDEVSGTTFRVRLPLEASRRGPGVPERL